MKKYLKIAEELKSKGVKVIVVDGSKHINEALKETIEKISKILKV